jgi:hypothetical protein
MGQANVKHHSAWLQQVPRRLEQALRSFGLLRLPLG